MIRELSQDETLLVAGGNANSAYEGGTVKSKHNSSSWSHLSKQAPRDIYAGTDECASGVFGSLVKGFPNPVKMGYGVAINAHKCLSSNGGGRGSSLGGDSSPNSVNGQCHW